MKITIYFEDEDLRKSCVVRVENTQGSGQKPEVQPIPAQEGWPDSDKHEIEFDGDSISLIVCRKEDDIKSIKGTLVEIVDDSIDSVGNGTNTTVRNIERIDDFMSEENIRQRIAQLRREGQIGENTQVGVWVSATNGGGPGSLIGIEHPQGPLGSRPYIFRKLKR